MIRRRFVIRFILTLLILGILSVMYIILMPLHDIDCNAEPFMSSKVENFQVSATKVGLYSSISSKDNWTLTYP